MMLLTGFNLVLSLVYMNTSFVIPDYGFDFILGEALIEFVSWNRERCSESSAEMANIAMTGILEKVWSFRALVSVMWTIVWDVK